MSTNLTLGVLLNSQLRLSLGGSGDDNHALNHQQFLFLYLMLIVLRLVPRVDLCFTRIGGTKGITIFSFPELKRNPVTEREGKKTTGLMSIILLP